MSGSICGGLKCPCCEGEFSLDEMVMSICWRCQAGDAQCDKCLKRGIEFTNFDSNSGRIHLAHRFVGHGFTDGVLIASCGYFVALGRTSGPGIRSRCRKCFKGNGRI